MDADGLTRLIHDELATAAMGRQADPTQSDQRFALKGEDGAPERAYRLP